MPNDRAGSHRDAPAEQSDSSEPDTPQRTTDERTARVLEDAEDLVDLIDDILFEDIKDEEARNELAKRLIGDFVQKGGQ